MLQTPTSVNFLRDETDTMPYQETYQILLVNNLDQEKKNLHNLFSRYELKHAGAALYLYELCFLCSLS